jgi:hypothetical protein
VAERLEASFGRSVVLHAWKRGVRLGALIEVTRAPTSAAAATCEGLSGGASTSAECFVDAGAAGQL